MTNAEVSDERPIAWRGWWSGAGSIDSTTRTTHIERIAKQWAEEGAEVTPLVALTRRSVTSQASEVEIAGWQWRNKYERRWRPMHEDATEADFQCSICEYRPVYTSPSKRVERLETALKPKAGDAADRIGKWLSAALEDPGVCAEMKADINAWFEAGQPVLKPAMEACDGDLLDFKLHLIAKTADPHADLSIEERSLYALLSLPRAAQAICTEVELETVTTTVTAAMRAAVGRQALQGDPS